MACRTLDVMVVRAKDLEDVNIISVMDVYVVISISGDPQTPQRTHIHAEGHRNSRWNESFRFTIPTADAGHLALHVRLCSQPIFGVSDIGEVYVLLRDLLAEPAGYILSFPVRSTSGAKHDNLFLSYRVGEPVRDPAASGKSLVRPWAAKATATYDEPPS